MVSKSDLLIRDFTRMILEGLVYIHDYGYVHCDLKSDNLLVFPSGDSSSYSLKISDFGNTLEVGEVPDYWEIDFPFVGTPLYMPPESLHDGVAKKSIDLWSVGCIVLEMYTGKRPWKEVGIDYLTTLLLNGKAPEILESVPCDAKDFIEKCFSRNPEDRGSAHELLLHQFLRQEEKKPEDVAVAIAKHKQVMHLVFASVDLHLLVSTGLFLSMSLEGSSHQDSPRRKTRC